MIIACLIIYKIMMILYVLSILNVIRHVYNVVRILFDDDNNKYLLTTKQLRFLGVSVAYIVTGLILGINLCV